MENEFKKTWGFDIWEISYPNNHCIPFNSGYIDFNGITYPTPRDIVVRIMHDEQLCKSLFGNKHELKDIFLDSPNNNNGIILPLQAIRFRGDLTQYIINNIHKV